MKKILFTCFLIFSSICTYYSQPKHGQARIDSLLSVLPAAKEDTNKVNLLTHLSYTFSGINPIEGIKYGKQAEVLAEKLNWKKGVALANNYIGLNNELNSDFDKALTYYLKALKLNDELGDKHEKASTLVNIGNIYNSKSNYAKALEYYLSSLKIYEELGEKEGMGNNFGNIGVIYSCMGDYNKALKYYLKQEKIEEELGNKSQIASSLQNTGITYIYKEEPSKSMEYFFKALKIEEELGNKVELARITSNLGSAYESQNDYPNALKYSLKSLEIANELGNKSIIAQSLGTLGIMYNYMGQSFKSSNQKIMGLTKEEALNKSVEYSKRALAVYQEIGELQNIQISYEALYEAQQTQGNFKDAIENLKLSITMKDSIFSDENKRQIIAMTHQRDEDIKQKQIEIQNLQLEAAKRERRYLIGGIGLLIVFAGFMFNRFIITRRQKNIIELQKDVVEDKNREITKSIEYALRIQTAILPPNKIVKQYLENSFILYKPKDIVAGDFYWMETVQTSNPGEQSEIILFAACDCTGHGVPGAIVSVMCHNALNRAVREFGLTQPAAILNKTAEIVIENFSKSEVDIADGMDISLCKLDIQKGELQWAGANNPLWLLQNGELIEIKGDKQPIGKIENYKPFTNHILSLNNNDTIYLFTDGFADQFGGTVGQKKLTRKRFKELIMSVQDKSLPDQGNALNDFITKYRNKVEQIDDILVMGVRV